jgi:hypothetical protein
MSDDDLEMDVDELRGLIDTQQDTLDEQQATIVELRKTLQATQHDMEQRLYATHALVVAMQDAIERRGRPGASLDPTLNALRALKATLEEEGVPSEVLSRAMRKALIASGRSRETAGRQGRKIRRKPTI